MEITSSAKGLKVAPKNVSTEPPTTYKLSPEQLQYYNDNGFLVIKRLIDFTDLYNYKQHFIRVCNNKVPRGQMTVVKDHSLTDKVKKKEDYINKIQDIHHDEVFMTYTEHPLLVDVVAQIVGDDVLVVHSMFINKPPGTSIHPPHQDLHYFPFRPADKIIGTWTAVDDVSTENGCLWVVPGSHKTSPLYEHAYKDLDALKMYHGITDEEAARMDKRVDLEMAPGDTVVFHPLLVHGSGANTTKRYRKSISAHYANAQCECVDVRGTVQAGIAEEVEREASRRGFQISFADIWRFKSKDVRRKSKL